MDPQTVTGLVEDPRRAGPDEPDAKHQALDPGLRDALVIGRPIAAP